MAHLIGLSPLTADECLIFPWICTGKVNDHVQVAVKRKCASVSSDLKALYKSVIIIIIIMWKTSASVRRIYDKRGGGAVKTMCNTLASYSRATDSPVVDFMPLSGLL